MTLTPAKKKILIGLGIAAAIVAAYMAYVYWRRNIAPAIISMTPKSRADELAFNDMLDIIKNGGGHASELAGFDAIVGKAGDDYNGNTISPEWGHSKTGGLMGAANYYYNNPDARPKTTGLKLFYRGSWMPVATYLKLRTRWQQYQATAQS